MNNKSKDIIQLVLVLGVVIVINILAQFFWTKVDLTEDKRFSFSQPTIDIIESVDKPMFFRVLLEGDFPVGFKRLQSATEEMLREIHSINPLIEYEFYNPNQGSNQDFNERKIQWSKDGINPVNFRMKSGDERVEKLIYPFAIVSFNNKKNHINLLEEQLPGMNQDVALNNSINLLEYKFAQIIDYIQMNKQPAVVFSEGQGELASVHISSMYKELNKFYRVGRLNLDSVYTIPTEISVLVVAKPTRKFSEQKKFMIDQYVMNGGKVLWLIDKINVVQDSLKTKEFYYPNPVELNLDDLFFKYGFRINTDLVMDKRSSRIPLVIGESAGRSQVDMFPWYYHLLVSPSPKSLISKSLNPVNLLYANSIDTIQTKNAVEKTVLLSTSEQAKFVMSPIRLSLEILRINPEELNFNNADIPVSILLEGHFNSLYENRVTQGMKNGLSQLNLTFKNENKTNSMIVVSDGDIISNNFRADIEETSPTGFNPYENAIFANKDFLLNGIEYLIDSDGVMSARNKSIKIRLINNKKVESEKTWWQFFNVGIPLISLLLIGILFNFYRKRKYK